MERSLMIKWKIAFQSNNQISFIVRQVVCESRDNL